MTRREQDRAALRDLDDVLMRAAGIVARGREAFDADDAIRLACEALAARVGEIARERLTDTYRQHRADVPWSDIIRMRDLLLHQYHRTDYELVWVTVSEQMPRLREQLAADIDAARSDPKGSTVAEADRRGAPRWEPDTPRCGSTDTADGSPCRSPVASAGRRCGEHR